jgi:hypothetical protein
MAKQYKLYLDVCCLNRPFDSWQQDRVYSEEWQLISSEAIEAELERLPNPEKRQSIQ